MEQIYTIPVNEAFDLVGEKPECGCPFCVLYKKLQEDELDIILGASMMEPDIRMKTNEEGFCLDHYSMMLVRKRMLGMGLILESHLAEVKKRLKGPTVLGNKRTAAIASLGELEESCYVCGRIKKNLSAMIATAVYLWESDPDFPKKFEKAPYFCLPHYQRLMEYAKNKLDKQKYDEFFKDISLVQEQYFDKIIKDVSWFCKKFDYRYDAEPWYDSKDAVERAIRFLSSGVAPDKK